MTRGQAMACGADDEIFGTTDLCLDSDHFCCGKTRLIHLVLVGHTADWPGRLLDEIWMDFLKFLKFSTD